MEHVTIAAELSGWRRFGPADEWLKRNMQIAKGPKPELLRTMFSRFIDERRQAMGGAAMSPQEKDALFQQFQSGKIARLAEALHNRDASMAWRDDETAD